MIQGRFLLTASVFRLDAAYLHAKPRGTHWALGGYRKNYPGPVKGVSRTKKRALNAARDALRAAEEWESRQNPDTRIDDVEASVSVSEAA